MKVALAKNEAAGTGREEVRELIARLPGQDQVPERFKIITDTTEFFQVEYNDVVVLAGIPYLIKGCEREGRFGLNDEPKFWVRRAIDLTDGSTKILKLVFHESFDATIGDMVFKCFRSPKKEARILELIGSHPNFMHGHAERDTAGNIVRIIDYIRGRQLDKIIYETGKDHEDYFLNYFPAILEQFIELAKAILFLHEHGEKHGDIRRDHILMDRETKKYRWIDFDYNYMHGENFYGYDLHGLGNILLFLTGQGDVTTQDLHLNRREIFDSLYQEDLNVIFKNRVANLKKVYPYIPESFNNVLRHFSLGANIFYDNTGEFIAELEEAREDFPH